MKICIGRGIAFLRKTRTVLTQREFAELIGVSREYLALLETNRKTPSLPLLYKIAENLDVPPFVLLSEPLNEKAQEVLDSKVRNNIR